MTFVRGLLASRAHGAFLVGLVVAASIIVFSGSWEERLQGRARSFRELPERLGLDATAPAPRKTWEALSPKEQAWARLAWRYFENNTQAETGLVNAADRYPSTTLWDVGSCVFGLAAAEELGVIDGTSFGSRMGRLLDALARLPLVDGQLPNKAYHTATLHPVNYDNSEAPAGVGWSALDLGRLAAAFTLVSWSHPEHTPRIRQVLSSWRMERLALDGRLHGASRDGSGALIEAREATFGYEPYAAKGLFLIAVDAGRSRQLDPDLRVTPVSGQLIAHNPPLAAPHPVVPGPGGLRALRPGRDRVRLERDDVAARSSDAACPDEAAGPDRGADGRLRRQHRPGALLRLRQRDRPGPSLGHRGFRRQRRQRPQVLLAQGRAGLGLSLSRVLLR